MRHGERFGLGPDFEQQMRDLGEQMKDTQFGNIQETVRQAREQARMAREKRAALQKRRSAWPKACT